MKLNFGIWVLGPICLCLQALDLAKSYGAFFPGPPKMSPRSQSRPRPSPYRQGQAAGVFCKHGQFSHGCCKGWERNPFGECKPVCSSRCVHGRCVGPNKCQCDNGWAGKTCNRDFNECAVQPCQHRCMNMQGSYRCYCEHGYLLLADGRSCSADDRCYKTRCAFGCVQMKSGFMCYCPGGLELTSDGLGCRDVDECAVSRRTCARNRRCVNTYGNYMCLCPEGYHYAYVEGELECVDMDECDMDMDRCHDNAHCINSPDGYDCECNGGYIGDGYKCIQFDVQTCSDSPCFAGAECTDIDIDVNAIDIDAVDIVRGFACGECPGGLAGDGINCAPSIVELRVLVIDPSDNNLRIPGARVSAFDQLDDGRFVMSSITDPDGVTMINVPMFSNLIITVSKDQYVENSVVVEVVPNRNNFVTVRINRAIESMELNYDPNQQSSFRFTRSADNSFLGAINVPRGALKAAPGSRETAYIIVPDANSASEVDMVPVLQADPRSAPPTTPPGRQRGSLAAVESQPPRLQSGIKKNGKKKGKTNRRPSRGPPPDYFRTNEEDITLTEQSLSMKRSPLDVVAVAYASVRVEDEDVSGGFLKPVTIEIPMAKYESKGLRDGDEMAAWQYDDIKGLWRYAGIGSIRHIPGDPNSLMFVYETTSLGWIAAGNLVTSLKTIPVRTCTNATCLKTVPNVQLWLHGIDSIYSEPVITDTKGKTEIVVRLGSTFTLEQRCNGISKQFQVRPDVQKIDLTIFDEFSCPDPGEPDNGARFGKDFTFGSEVTYYCFAGYIMNGSSRRMCDGCGIWSGYATICEEHTNSDFSSYSSTST